MSSPDDFILQWLNESLNIVPPIKNIQKEFCNGYKYALVLNRLNLITSEELNEIKDTNNILEIKSNFKRIKSFLHFKLNLDIREDEFNDVMNKDKAKSVIILYKIKNSVNKKNMNFLEIKTSDEKPSKDEIRQKINELMQDSIKEEKKENSENEPENENVENIQRKEVYNKYTIRKMFDPKNDLNPIESVTSNLNIKNKNSESNENNLEYNNNRAYESNSTKRNKKLLPKIKIKPNLKYLYNNKNILDEKKNEIDFFNDYGMLKLNEIKNKKKYEELKKQERAKLLINKNNIYELKEKYKLDFLKKLDNPLYQFSKSTRIKLFSPIHDKYNSYSKRYDYAKKFTEFKKRDDLNHQILNIKKLMYQNTEEININVNTKKSSKIFLRPLPMTTKNSVTKFNKINYLNEVAKINISDYISKKSKRYSHIKQVYPDIKNVLTSIIDLTEDIYEYQQENENEILELKDFQNFIESFILNKQKKKVVQIVKSESVDNIKNIIKLDPNSIQLTDNEKFLVQDYINYIGEWNYKKIITTEEKFDLRKIKSDLPPDYEPTIIELDDITIPNKLYDNYSLGNTILNLIENKYNENITQEKKEINIENKWNYIPYKISLIGYPLSGRKLLAANIIKKYPNMKIYSIRKIFREYYIQYKDITEQIEGNPKYNNLKPNQIEQLKEEKNKKKEEFEPIINILKPFIDIINEEKKNKFDLNKNIINKSPNKSPKKTRRQSISKDKNNLMAGSPKKTERNKLIENEVIFIEENINEDLKKIPSDDILFNLLKYTIEKDFIKQSNEDIEKEIIDSQKKIFEIKKELDNYEKIKAESNKPNPKNDSLINNLNQNLENIKLSSIKGFILVDYPTNINQSILLENYLTGYEDELQKPKSEKNQIIKNTSNFFDYKIKPKENTTIKKAGLDFVINLKTDEKDIEQRFQNIKYDPNTDIIYTDLNEINDKKILDRLVDEVPYLNKENMNFYKEEYNNNIMLIKSLYNKFGMNIDNNEDDIIEEEQIKINFNFDSNNKQIKKCFQQIEFDSFIDNNKLKKENIDNDNNNNEALKNIKSTKNSGTNSPRKKTMRQELSKNDIEEKNLKKASDFISDEIINNLYKEKDKSDKILFYSKNPELNNDNNNNTSANPEEKISNPKIRFESDIKINETSEEKKKKNNLGQSTFSSKNFNRESLFISSMSNNLDNIIKSISEFNIKYNNNIGKFIYLINIQKNKIYLKLNEYQKNFRDFLNQKTTKKKLIHIFIKKYNEFFEKNNLFENDKAINEFNDDIEEISNDLWLLINEKEKNSVKELNNIKNDGFMQKELEKFNFNINSMFLIETEKFIEMINAIIYLYSNLNGNKNNNNIDLNKLIEEQIDKNNIFKDTIDIKINNINIDELISQILSNINIIFENSIKIIFSYEQIISKLIDEIKNLEMLSSTKKFLKKSTKNSNNSNNTSTLNQGGATQFLHDKILKMIQNEKNKYKYRILYLKNFSKQYITLIIKTSQNIYNNLDQWIVTSISLQNDALNNVISIFKSKLNERQIIDEKNDINIIEMDEFEKNEEENLEEKDSEINIKPIDDGSVCFNRVYNKLNIDYLINNNLMDLKVEEEISDKNNEDKIYKIIALNELEENKLKENDFYFDINKFNEIYINIKKYEIEPNVINKDLFYEIFIKPYIIDKYNENNNDTITENNSDKTDKNKRKEKKKKNKKEISAKEEEIKSSNNINENLTINQNLNLNNLTGICQALKSLNSKQISKLYSLYKHNIVYKNKKEDNNNNSDNEEVKEYEIYLNTNEIFTVLVLIGCKVLNAIEEENIFKDLKDLLISEKYITKKDFMNYNFWFEKDFEYQNFIKHDEVTPKRSKKNAKDNICNINIKEFIFNLWKDDDGNRMDFGKFISLINMNRYMTDINAFKEQKYFNLIFES